MGKRAGGDGRPPSADEGAPGTGRVSLMTTVPEHHEPDSIRLVMAAGLPGFGAARAFTLQKLGGSADPFFLLRSRDIDGLQFVVVQPERFFSDYRPPIDSATAERLNLAPAEDPLVLVMVTVDSPAAGPTANLLGPIVVNRRTMGAAQLFVQGDDDLFHARLLHQVRDDRHAGNGPFGVVSG